MALELYPAADITDGSFQHLARHSRDYRHLREVNAALPAPYSAVVLGVLSAACNPVFNPPRKVKTPLHQWRDAVHLFTTTRNRCWREDRRVERLPRGARELLTAIEPYLNTQTLECSSACGSWRSTWRETGTPLRGGLPSSKSGGW
jgi:hypothetical protein